MKAELRSEFLVNKKRNTITVEREFAARRQLVYTALDGFCDDTGTLNPELPRSSWDVMFSDASGRTLVETIVAYKSHEELEKVMQMGMQEGLTSTLECLDELLLALGK